MKYEQIAESLHFYNHVFYETEKRTMYIYCPNCGSEHEVKITKSQGVNWIKQHHTPCSCFEYRGVQPKYKQTQYEHANLDHQLSLAEFENRNGEAVLVAYFHTASFNSSKYDCFRPFRRAPDFDEDKTIEIHFKNDGTVSMDTALYIPMCSRSLKVGSWSQAKNWRTSSFIFDIIEESIQELQGTNLEQFIPQIERFQSEVTSRFNIDQTLNEIFAAWLIQMHTSQQVKKLWKSGYDRIVFDRTIEKMIGGRPYNTYYSHGYYTFSPTAGVINWRGKTLEKILKIKPSKFDLVSERHDATITELRGAQAIAKLEKFGVDCSAKNVDIATQQRFDALLKLFAETNLPISKMFKFIRNTANKKKDARSFSLGIITNDYFDYLETLKKLGTPYTKDVVFPCKFKESHDRAAETSRNLTIERKDKIFIKEIQKYLDLAYASEEYKIEVVKSATQLKASKLHNCAAGYIDRIVGGECAIFVIRQKKCPRTPFFMLELNLNTLAIIQTRGQRNIAAPETVKNFAEEWLAKIVKANAKKLMKAA